ncbi:efflux RND transporter periplasmic adaptor subunit [Geothrix alkalitolerans]|uniref:efflux RND transporter periplasmic adaptor subunit n=1 Tax=Geothrix alkalitolerans TaxID=2922724 RepID=UPI001FAFD085|nr:HlyD family efflux transporter periplasmic adaptor subunit [Geothrix alkalitolerans]
MDLPRNIAPRRRHLRLMIGIGAVMLLVAGLALLKPPVPTVEHQNLLVDAVKRGPLLIQIRGSGSLVPVHVRWLTTAAPGRVERLVALPGAVVKAEDLILELSNPELQQSALDAAWQLKAAEADLQAAKARLQGQLLDVRASLASAKANRSNAGMGLQASEALAKAGLISHHDLLKARTLNEELDTRLAIEEGRLQSGSDSMKAQLASFQARVEQARALYTLKRTQVDGLKIRAGLDGVLQQLPVQVGQQLEPGAILAKVAQPTQLKAELKIGETQAKDLSLGLTVHIDTRNGVVSGRIARIDPSVQGGTVTVDVSLDDPLPKGARPDLSVEGVVEVDRIADALHVGRPVQAQAQGQASLFRLSADGTEATRVKVAFGRGSVSTLEVLEGLRVGDRVILSDASAWDGFDRIRIK